MIADFRRLVTEKDTSGTSGRLNLTDMWGYTGASYCQMGHLRFVHFDICKFYFKKNCKITLFHWQWGAFGNIDKIRMAKW